MFTSHFGKSRKIFLLNGGENFDLLEKHIYVTWIVGSHKQETLRENKTFSLSDQLIEILPIICFCFTGRCLLMWGKVTKNCQTTYKPWTNKVFPQVEVLCEIQLQKEHDSLRVHYFECTFELAKNPTIQLNCQYINHSHKCESFTVGVGYTHGTSWRCFFFGWDKLSMHWSSIALTFPQ